jgi:hypothetical protein
MRGSSDRPVMRKIYVSLRVAAGKQLDCRAGACCTLQSIKTSYIEAKILGATVQWQGCPQALFLQLLARRGVQASPITRRCRREGRVPWQGNAYQVPR